MNINYRLHILRIIESKLLKLAKHDANVIITYDPQPIVKHKHIAWQRSFIQSVIGDDDQFEFTVFALKGTNRKIIHKLNMVAQLYDYISPPVINQGREVSFGFDVLFHRLVGYSLF